jgi:tocopherol O-methyltransferase
MWQEHGKSSKTFASDATFCIFLADGVRISRDISLSLIQSPSLWALAFAQGRDFVAFLKAFKAMKRGYANGTFRYAVMVFQKPDPSL